MLDRPSFPGQGGCLRARPIDPSNGLGRRQISPRARRIAEFDGNKVHLSLTANPSHLEIVDPVVLGKVRAKQDQLADTIDRVRSCRCSSTATPPSRAGRHRRMLRPVRAQGPPHRRFGAFHRQQPDSASPPIRATRARRPIRRRGEDDRSADLPQSTATYPEAVTFGQVAIEFRQMFQQAGRHRHVLLSRFGHNEGDEPGFTQPLMYKKIRSHPTTLELYSQKLIGEGVITDAEVDKLKGDWRKALEIEYESGQSYKPNKGTGSMGGGRACGGQRCDRRRPPRPRPASILARFEGGRHADHRPAGRLHIHKTIGRFLENAAR